MSEADSKVASYRQEYSSMYMSDFVGNYWMRSNFPTLHEVHGTRYQCVFVPVQSEVELYRSMQPSMEVVYHRFSWCRYSNELKLLSSGTSSPNSF